MIVLASGSPRRREILTALGLTFEVRASDIDETLREGEDAYEAAERLAREKAMALHVPAGTTVIAADTLVVLDGVALGKPGDSPTAVGMLRRLSGRRHDVVTGVAIRRDDTLVSARDVTVVAFAELTDDEITRYVATGEPLDRAGAYAMQSIAGLFVTRVEGSPSNVVGLPVRLLYTLAGKAGLDLLG